MKKRRAPKKKNNNTKRYEKDDEGGETIHNIILIVAITIKVFVFQHFGLVVDGVDVADINDDCDVSVVASSPHITLFVIMLSCCDALRYIVNAVFISKSALFKYHFHRQLSTLSTQNAG